MLELLPDMVSEVIIVDGHSTDDTVAVAFAARPDAKIVYQDGKGKGNALTCGFKLSTGEITVMLDADGSTDPAEIPRFVAALTNGYDFAKGTRFMTGGGSVDITPFRRLGNRCLTTAREPDLAREVQRPLLRLQRILDPLRARHGRLPRASRSRP